MRGPHIRVGGTLTRSPPHQRQGGTTLGRRPRVPRFFPALQGRNPRRRAPPPPPPQTSSPPSPASLLDFFRRISAALHSRATPQRQSPPRGRRRPQPKAARSVADMLRAHPPHAAADNAGGSSSDPVADAPSAPSPPQSTLPQRRQHGLNTAVATIPALRG